MASEEKIVAASMVKFLQQRIDSNKTNEDTKESLEVSIQCIESAFELEPKESVVTVDLLELVREKRVPMMSKAERMKNEGNELMKTENYRQALQKYTEAIQIDPCNAVFFCNRAAAHFKLGDYEDSVADCKSALVIQPRYSKAYGRLGLALTALSRHREAQAAYTKASELDPGNNCYKVNLRLTEEELNHSYERLDLSGILENPAVVNLASEMLGHPGVHSMVNEIMTSQSAHNDQTPISAWLEMGQAFAQHMQNSNPALLEALRLRAQQDAINRSQNQG